MLAVHWAFTTLRLADESTFPSAKFPLDSRSSSQGRAEATGAVEELGRPLVDDPDRMHPVETLGVGETWFRAGKASSHRTSYVTDLVRREQWLRLCRQCQAGLRLGVGT